MSSSGKLNMCEAIIVPGDDGEQGRRDFKDRDSYTTEVFYHRNRQANRCFIPAARSSAVIECVCADK